VTEDDELALLSTVHLISIHFSCWKRRSRMKCSSRPWPKIEILKKLVIVFQEHVLQWLKWFVKADRALIFLVR